MTNATWWIYRKRPLQLIALPGRIYRPAARATIPEPLHTLCVLADGSGGFRGSGRNCTDMRGDSKPAALTTSATEAHPLTAVRREARAQARAFCFWKAFRLLSGRPRVNRKC